MKQTWIIGYIYINLKFRDSELIQVSIHETTLKTFYENNDQKGKFRNAIKRNEIYESVIGSFSNETLNDKYY